MKRAASFAKGIAGTMLKSLARVLEASYWKALGIPVGSADGPVTGFGDTFLRWQRFARQARLVDSVGDRRARPRWLYGRGFASQSSPRYDSCLRAARRATSV
jgi:hypothetical protein